MKKIKLLLGLLYLTANSIIAQVGDTSKNLIRCATQVPPVEWEQWFSAKVKEFKNSRNNIAAINNYSIPIIVHILHDGDQVGQGENISLAQINSQITILNADYSGTNSDVSNIPQIFQEVKAGNTGIQFCFAKQSPNGTPLTEIGVDRINWQARGWTDPNSFPSTNNAIDLKNYFNTVIKPNSYWDPGRYLNIWIAKIDNSNLLGYALFPLGSGLSGIDPSSIETEMTSGAVISQSVWGNIGTAANGVNNKGRTATHEIGHYLGVHHTFKDGCIGNNSTTCSSSGDFCCDTPPTSNPNFNCPATSNPNQNTCIETPTDRIDMTMNYMDYGDDACIFMFTADQAIRMQTAMTNGTYRSTLNSSPGCTQCFDQFEPNNIYTSGTPFFGSPLGAGTSDYTIGANIGYQDDVDWYKFTLASCGNLTITLSNLPYNYNIELYGPGGSTQQAIAGSYSSGTQSETINFQSPSSVATTYYVKIYSNHPSNFSNASCYNLRMQWASTACVNCAVPTTQASNINLSNITISSMALNWANGNGSRRIVKMNKTNTFTTLNNGTNPTANNIYSGSGEQVIYNGNGNSVTVNGLNTSTIGYCFRVYEANCTLGSSLYNSSTVSNNPNCSAASQTYSINTSSNPVIGGTTTGTGNYSSGQQTTVVATSNTGYTFVNWTENGSHVTSTASYTFNVTANRNLVAHFSSCNYTLNSNNVNIYSPAASLSFWVYTNPDCSWTATTSGCSGMITLNNATGIGNGLVTFNVSSNASPSARSCTITVGGQTFTVNQNGFVAPCSIAPSAPNSLSAGYIGSNQSYISWAGSSANVTTFELERGLSVTGPFTLIATTGTNFGYNDVTGISGTTYYYRVRACCNSNCSNYSNVTSIQACSFSASTTGIVASANTICLGDSVTLTLQGGNLGTGAVWTWRSTQCGSGPIVATGVTSIKVAPTVSGYYVVKPEGGGCVISVNCSSIYITVNQLPSGSIIYASDSTTFCSGASVILSGNNNGIWSNGATTPSITVTTSGNYYVTNTNSCGSTISNHIPVTVIQPFYTFIGTGNWDDASNWSNNAIPPYSLISCSEIIIDPIFGGECILNMPQILTSGSKLTVRAGAKFTVTAIQ